MIHPFLSRVPPKLDSHAKRGSLKQRCNWQEIARKYSGQMKKALRKIGGGEQYDINESMMRRRERAVVKYTPLIVDRYQNLPGFAPEWMDETGDKFIDFNFTPADTYNRMEANSSLLLAASIWILDEVTPDTGKRESLFRLLPRQEEALEEVWNPQDVWHSSYEDVLIESVQHVLQYRNRDVAPVELEADDTERVITSALIAEGRQHADVPSRRAFEQLMELIPRESIDRAVAYFESLFWQWTDRFFDCLEPLVNLMRDDYREAEELLVRYERMRKDAIRIAEEFDRRVASGKSPMQPFNPLLSSAAQENASLFPLPAAAWDKASKFAMPSKDTDLERFFSMIDSLIDLGKRHFDFLQKGGEKAKKIYDFYEDIMMSGYLRDKACREKFGDEVMNRMHPLRIEKPFEACFALLWLIESGSDLPWLYGCGCGLMEEVAESLPWGVFRYREDHDPVWWKDAEEEEERPAMEDAAAPDSDGEQDAAPEQEEEKQAAVSTDGWPALLADDWYRRKYVSNEDEAFRFARSLAQIVYEETGCILPRDLRLYAERKRTILDYGVSDGEADFLQFLFSVLGQTRRSMHALNFDEAFMSYLDEREAGESASGRMAESVEEDQLLSAEELGELLKAEREKNRQLRDALHEAEKNAREARQDLASIREEAVLERRELADLRELVFNAETEEEETAPEKVDETRYPFEVQKHTIVFGGHSSWLKAIRPMLTGNIRFIERDPDFSLNVIRNADIIWIQANALSHSMFYRIADTARQYHKPLRYFSYASAARCAQQVLEADG